VAASPRVPAEPAMTARSTPPRRLVLVLDDQPARVHATAKAVRETAPEVRMLVLDTAEDTAACAALVERRDAGDGPAPDVILVRADPGGWAAASVLAAHHPPRSGRPVDAFLVAEGPLEMFSVLITDFPGLRLLPPGAEVAAVVAGLVQGNVEEAK
jgi:hypothetical protein